MKADNGGGEDSVHLLSPPLSLSLSLTSRFFVYLTHAFSHAHSLSLSLSIYLHSFDLTSAYVGGVGLV